MIIASNAMLVSRFLRMLGVGDGKIGLKSKVRKASNLLLFMLLAEWGKADGKNRNHRKCLKIDM